MVSYFVADLPNGEGEHELHVPGCARFPHRRSYVGEYARCPPALAEAGRIKGRVNGCALCCAACHRRASPG